MHHPNAKPHATSHARRALLGLAAYLLPAIPAAQSHAQPAAVTDSEPAAKVRIVASHEDLAPGTITWIGIEFDIADKWHIYWPGQNDSGYAPSIEWTLPQGVTAGPLHWPTPKRYVMPGDILDHTYEGKLILLTPLTISPGFNPVGSSASEATTIKAEVSWLECEEGCVPREASLTHTFALAQSEAPRTSQDNAAIQAQLKALPIADPAVVAEAIKVSWLDREHATILATNPLASRIAFYPHEDGLSVSSILATAEAKGQSVKLRVTPSRDKHLQGIVQVWNQEGRSLGAYLLNKPPEKGDAGTIK